MKKRKENKELLIFTTYLTFPVMFIPPGDPIYGVISGVISFQPEELALVFLEDHFYL